jgi:hypothetical protein
MNSCKNVYFSIVSSLQKSVATGQFNGYLTFFASKSTPDAATLLTAEAAESGLKIGLINPMSGGTGLMKFPSSVPTSTPTSRPSSGFGNLVQFKIGVASCTVLGIIILAMITSICIRRYCMAKFIAFHDKYMWKKPEINKITIEEYLSIEEKRTAEFQNKLSIVDRLDAKVQVELRATLDRHVVGDDDDETKVPNENTTGRAYIHQNLVDVLFSSTLDEAPLNLSIDLLDKLERIQRRQSAPDEAREKEEAMRARVRITKAVEEIVAKGNLKKPTVISTRGAVIDLQSL